MALEGMGEANKSRGPYGLSSVPNAPAGGCTCWCKRWYQGPARGSPSRRRWSHLRWRPPGGGAPPAGREAAARVPRRRRSGRPRARSALRGGQGACEPYGTGLPAREAERDRGGGGRIWARRAKRRCRFRQVQSALSGDWHAAKGERKTFAVVRIDAPRSLSVPEAEALHDSLSGQRAK